MSERRIAVTRTPPAGTSYAPRTPRTPNGVLAQRILDEHAEDMQAGAWVTISGYGDYMERKSLRSTLHNQVRRRFDDWVLTTYLAHDRTTFCIALVRKVQP